MDKKEESKQSQQSNQSEERAVDWEDVAKRAMADLDNYKKQVERDRVMIAQITKGNALARFLEIYDDLKRAIEFLPEGEAGKGVMAVLSKFHKMLEEEGLEALVIGVGDKFDPFIMDAVSYEEHSLIKDNHVIEMVEAGLKFRDKIIKPAKVRVGK